MIVGVLGLVGLSFLMDGWMLSRLYDGNSGVKRSSTIANSSLVSVQVRARNSIWRWGCNTV